LEMEEWGHEPRNECKRTLEAGKGIERSFQKGTWLCTHIHVSPLRFVLSQIY
jgi:hypothetical protein